MSGASAGHKRGSRAIQPPHTEVDSEDASDQQTTTAQPQPAAAGTPSAGVSEQEQSPMKRTRREQRSALATAATDVAPMMRLLRRDVHAVHSVLRMLEFDDLILLASTCRTWRSWVEHPPAHLLEAFLLARDVQPELLSSLARSPLARTYLVDLPVSKHSWAPLAEATSRATVSEVLLTLPSFTRLTSLKVELSRGAVDAIHLHSCFASLAGRLTHLELRLRGLEKARLASLVLSEIDVLRRLIYLDLTAVGGLDFEVLQLPKVQFEPLASLPALETFHFFHRDFIFSCSNEQAQALAQCKSLTEIICGSWSRVDYVHSRASAQEIDEGPLGILVRGQLATMRGRGLPVPPMRNINLHVSTMTSAVLAQLLQLRGLTSIMPTGWSSDITPEQWSQLPQVFAQLKEIGIGGLQAERYLPSLLQCSQLRSVRIDASAISSTQLRDLCTRLAKLVKLNLTEMEIESLQPLEALADRCTTRLFECTGPAGAPLHARTNLPAMPELVALLIFEPEGQRMQLFEPLTQQLLARCPKLRREHFEQYFREDPDWTESDSD